MSRLVSSRIIAVWMIAAAAFATGLMTAPVHVSADQKPPPKILKPQVTKPVAKPPRKPVSLIKKPPSTTTATTARTGTVRGVTEAQRALYHVVNRGFVVRRDQFSYFGRSFEAPRSIVHLRVDKQTIHVASINRGELPRGSGGALLARTIKETGVKPKTLVFENVIHPGTQAIWKAGGPVGSTRIAKMAENTAALLGRSIRKIDYRPDRGKLNIIAHLN